LIFQSNPAHPLASTWPKKAVEAMKAKLVEVGEYALYESANKKLDERISRLYRLGVNVTTEVETLRILQNRVAKVGTVRQLHISNNLRRSFRNNQLCLSEEYLNRYRNHMLKLKAAPYSGYNKLREVNDEYVQKGYAFSYASEVIFAFDLCGVCESHTMMLTFESLSNVSHSIYSIKEKTHNSKFLKCPMLSRVN
jgi:hypothetical protein